MGAGWSNKRPSDKQFDIYLTMFEYLLKYKNVDVNTPGTYMIGNTIKMNDQDPSRRKRILFVMAQNGLKVKTLDNYLPSDYNNDPVKNKEDIKILLFLAEVGLEQRKEKFKQTFIDNVLKWGSQQRATVELAKWAISKGANSSKDNYKALQNALEKDNTELVKILLKDINKDPKYK